MAVVYRFTLPERRAEPLQADGLRRDAEIVILPCVRRESLADWTGSRSMDRTMSASGSALADEQRA